MPAPVWDADAGTDAVMAPTKQLLPRPVTLALLISLVASGGLAALLLTTDPSPRELRLFVALNLVATAGLGSVLAASLGGQTGRPLLDSLRAFRRGTLIGLACAGVVV